MAEQGRSSGTPTEFAMLVHRRLLSAYGYPELKPQREPLDELILTILSQNTNDTNSGRAWDGLQDTFASWQEVRTAPTERVAESIRVGGLANVKAPRIRAILDRLVSERGTLDLGFLRDLSVAEAREYLLDLPGVGPKTAACVLLFSLHKPALPVDTHVHRVALRLGLIPEKTGAAKAHALLEGLLPQDTYYPFHLNMIRHGRTLCSSRDPHCTECPLGDICRFADARGDAGVASIGKRD